MKTLENYNLQELNTLTKLRQVVEEITATHGDNCELDFYDGDMVVYEAEPEGVTKLRKQLDDSQHELFLARQQLTRAQWQLNERGSEILKLKHELVNLRVSRGVKDL